MTFEIFLKRIKKVNDKNIAYYLLRVNQFKRYKKANRNAQTEDFFDSLNTSLEPWQKAQAVKAIRYYSEYQTLYNNVDSINTEKHITPTKTRANSFYSEQNRVAVYKNRFNIGGNEPNNVNYIEAWRALEKKVIDELRRKTQIL